jgi:plasmid maintenance system antidote protein VapI
LRDWQRNSWLVAHETSAEFWLNLQKLYELWLAEAKAGATIRRAPKLAAREKSQGRKPIGRAA